MTDQAQEGPDLESLEQRIRHNGLLGFGMCVTNSEVLSLIQQVRTMDKASEAWIEVHQGDCDRIAEVEAENDQLREQLNLRPHLGPRISERLID